MHTTSSQPSPVPPMRMLGQIPSRGTLPCSHHLWRHPALLPLLPSEDPPGHPSAMGDHSPVLTRHQQSCKAPQSCGFRGRAAWRARPGGNTRVKGNGAAVPCVYPPAALPRSPPLSWADIFVGAGEASRFSKQPRKVENKTAESPLAWTRCPAAGAAQTQLRVPLLFPCCDKATRGGRRDPAPPGPARGTRQQQQRGAHLRGRAGEGAAAGDGAGSSPPEGGQAALRQIKVCS